VEWVAGFVWNQWQPWSGIRNLAEYEGEIDLSPALVQSVLKIAEEIEEAVLRLTGD
jgi:hypothetical protein